VFKGRATAFALAVFALISSSLPKAALAGDPYLPFYTLEAPHFRVHYHAGLEPIAQKVANIAEDVHSRLTRQLGWAPTIRTEVVVTDDTDGSNGIASTLPYPHILLFASAPDDMSSLGTYDDWMTLLFTHEYTHILQIDNVSGLPAVGNAILGRTFLPNEEQPRWILEGLAVAMETEHTRGGRLRSSQFEMFVRADVLAGRLARLDEMSHPVRRYPGGNLWYLYGAEFVGWIESIYGSDIYAAVAADYGATVMPWGINRAIRRATGRTYEELYAGFRADLEQRVAVERARIVRAGIREGRRLTAHGRTALAPRFYPARCGRAVAYIRDDGDSIGGVFRLPLDARDSDGTGDNVEFVARALSGRVSTTPDCGVVFDHVAPSRRHYQFLDLFYQPGGTSSPLGHEKRDRTRLTTGLRARDPDVSRDGRRIAYVTNSAGTTTLRIAERHPDGRLSGHRRLVPSARFEQAFTPRFSPDGRHVAYGTWTTGGFRDIRIVDADTGAFYELTHDRAIDQQPAWSPDGKTLYFVSDRTGVSNVFAYDIATHALFQVTNVLTGAFQPDVSPDGKSLVYARYDHTGFDLYELPLDRSRFIPAAFGAPEPAPAVSYIPTRVYPTHDYEPSGTVLPHAWDITVGQGTFGTAFTLSTTGADAIGRHAFAAAMTIETRHTEPQGALDYYYGKLPFGFRATLFRNAAPRRDYQIGNVPIEVVEHQTGVTTGVNYYLPGDFEYQDMALSYTIALWDHDRPVGDELDPFAPVPYEPHRGYLGMVHLGYDFSNLGYSANAISAEHGISLSLGADLADPAFGSDDTLTALYGTLRTYLALPWPAHHVLALGLSGGTSAGSYPRYGLYSTGGFADTPALDVYTTGVLQSGFVLRGYEPGQFVGSQFNLLNVEYRFPIAYVDRGVSTLPAFLQTLSGTLFVDWGGAYDAMDLERPLDVLQVGVGAEIWMDLLLGYYNGATLRLGVAKGLAAEAPSGLQTYFVAAAGF
jgi:hypothetical protein